MGYDPKLEDELLAQQEEKPEIDFRGQKSSKKKSLIKRLLDKIFHRYEEDDEDEHLASF